MMNIYKYNLFKDYFSLELVYKYTIFKVLSVNEIDFYTWHNDLRNVMFFCFFFFTDQQLQQWMCNCKNMCTWQTKHWCKSLKLCTFLDNYLTTCSVQIVMTKLTSEASSENQGINATKFDFSQKSSKTNGSQLCKIA